MDASHTPAVGWSSQRTRLALRIAVFALALGIQGGDAWSRYTPNRWLYADGSFYYNILKGLVEHGSLDQGHIHPRTWFNGTLGWNYNLDDAWSNIAVGRDGTWYPKHGFFMPALSVPFYLAFGPVGTLIFNVLCGALTALLCAELAARFTARWLASLVGIGMSSMPAIIRQAYGYNNDVFYTTLVLATAIEIADQRWARAGLFGGLSFLAKITNVLFLIPFGIWVLATRDKKAILQFVGWSALGIGIAALANWIMFGAPWITPYQRVLIVQNGAQVIASHVGHFTRDFDRGWQALWAQLRQTLPAYLVGFLGCLAFVWRRKWVEALVFALVLLGPLLFFAKYDWYREEFLDPSYALAAAPLGALCGLLFPPSQEPDIALASWRRGLLAAAGAFVVLALGRLVWPSDKTVTLSKLVPDSSTTQVLLGDVPCDYFNNQVGRWECSGFDRGQEWSFTGQTLDRLPSFNGVPRAPIDLNPNPSGQPRRMIFAPTWGNQLVFGYGIADGAQTQIPVELSVKLGGQEVLHETVSGPGWHEATLPTPVGTRAPLELTVTGQPTPARQLYVDGTLIR